MKRTLIPPDTWHVHSPIQTVSAIHSFYLAMMMYPEVQRKAQAEIDRVIESDRFPTLADQPSLPYVDALVKEVLRWNPVGPLGKFFEVVGPPLFRERLTGGNPLGIPHIATENDVYKGHFIPKGSTVIANIW